jgi:hypothetical protein
MKLAQSLNLAIAVLLFVSCSVTQKTTKSGYADGPNVVQKPVVADLQVSETKVSGTATGKRSQGIGDVKQLAIADALLKSNADVLIEPRYEIKSTFSYITVNVTGYPATYKNFRPMEIGDTLFVGQDEAVRKPIGLGSFEKNSNGMGAGTKAIILSGSGLALLAAGFFGAILFF